MRGVNHFLHVKPTYIPKTFLTNYFKDSKVILLSATILPADIREIAAGKPYKSLEINSGIPSERRPFYVIPTDSALTFPINYRDLANKIDEVLENIPLRPALIHVTYSDMQQISKYMKTPHLFHDKDTKQEVLDKWLNEGGVLLGGGMSEGLDLKGDLCRLNIVSKIQMPNIKDPYVQKRMHLPEGAQWLKLSALKQVVQSYGRSTRGPEDYSVTVCLDKRVFGLVNELKQETPDFFKEAIVPFSVSYGAILAKIEKLK
jgi:Rad3-related DNA helicase